MDIRYDVVHTDGVARRLVLERAANVRDLGGFATPDGLTAFGRVLRADQLGMLTDGDVAMLREGAAVVRTVDLRGLDEVGALGRGRLADAGVDHLHLPIRDRANDPEVLAARRGRTPAQVYLDQLEQAPVRYLAAVEALTADGTSVIHCTAGKDRTGLSAMLVLGALGVADDAIVDDYAATARVPADVKQASRDPNADAFWADYTRHADTADVQTDASMSVIMRELLELVDGRWGGIPEYFAAYDATPLIDGLRRRLLA